MEKRPDEGENISENSTDTHPIADLFSQTEQLDARLVSKIDGYLGSPSGLATLAGQSPAERAVTLLSFFEQLRTCNSDRLDPTPALAKIPTISPSQQKDIQETIRQLDLYDKINGQALSDNAPQPSQGVKGLVSLTHELADGTGLIYGYRNDDLPPFANFFLARQAWSRIATIESLGEYEKRELMVYLGSVGVVDAYFAKLTKGINTKNNIPQSKGLDKYNKDIEGIIKSQKQLLTLQREFLSNKLDYNGEQSILRQIVQINQRIYKTIDSKNELYLIHYGNSPSSSPQDIQALITQGVSQLDEVFHGNDFKYINKAPGGTSKEYLNSPYVNQLSTKNSALGIQGDSRPTYGLEKLDTPILHLSTYPFNKKSLWITHGQISQLIGTYITKDPSFPKLKKHTLSQFSFQGGEVDKVQLNTTKLLDNMK